VVLAVVAIAIVLAIGAVSAYAGLGSDVTAPTTATDAAASYWDSATIVATATDAEGIAYIYHELDNGVVRLATITGKPASAQLTIPTDKDKPLAAGTHHLKYWAQDVNGNVEAQHVVTFEIVADSVKPTTSASKATVVRGRTATLKYKVTDAEPTKGTATVWIKIKNSHGKTAKTISAGSVAVNESLKATFRCKLAKGTYTYYVYATDASGNWESKAGSAKLTVK
jgi:hypothetical protein